MFEHPEVQVHEQIGLSAPNFEITGPINNIQQKGSVSGLDGQQKQQHVDAGGARDERGLEICVCILDTFILIFA